MNKLSIMNFLKQALFQRGGEKKRIFPLLLLFFSITLFGLLFSFSFYFFFLTRELPSVESLKNYNPPLISTVLDKNGDKIGEFFKERRILVPYNELPPVLIQAFISAEDGQFFEHKGLNWKAIFRAFLANLKAGRKVQGGSTITQQVARSLLLSSEKTYKRKLKEAVLAFRMEKYLTKEEILYLYLNQIYLGHGAYGVGMAGEIYFKKKIKDLNLAESSLLAGLPQAPSRFSPIYNPQKAKERQLYVLHRMTEEGYIDAQKAEEISATPLKVFLRSKYEKAPYYIETVRQSLLEKLDEETLLTQGVEIKTAMDLSLQEIAKKSIQKGLRDLDKRQGFRGPLTQLESEQEREAFLKKEEEKHRKKKRVFRIIPPSAGSATLAGKTTEVASPSEEGTAGSATLAGKTTEVASPSEEGTAGSATLADKGTASLAGKTTGATPPSEDKISFQPGEILKALVREVSDEISAVLVELPFGLAGVIPLKNMEWAKEPNPKVRKTPLLKPSLALKAGDVIYVQLQKPEEQESSKEEQESSEEKTTSLLFYSFPDTEKEGFKSEFFKNLNFSKKASPETKLLLLSLEQEPLVEGALIALDQKTGDILALVGGYDFNRSQFNRAYQAARQTGSVFKPLVYLAGLDKGFTPSSLIVDAPVVYSEEEASSPLQGSATPLQGSETPLQGSESPPQGTQTPLQGTQSPESEEKTQEEKKWKPGNYGNRFTGDILFRNGLIRSMNVPTVRIIEKIGIQRVSDYARRLGVFSSLNPDYTLALGSSSVTLYEMTKVFSILGRRGKKISPILVQEVKTADENILLNSLSLDERFSERLQEWEDTMEEQKEEFLQSLSEKQNTEQENTEDTEDKEQENTENKEEAKKSPFFFKDPKQLISEKTSYIMTTLLKAVIQEGTGALARKLEWPLAGKTGTTNGYYDAWFIGYSPQIALGVWVGFDNEKTLGRGETGARAALPIWFHFMKEFIKKEKEKKKEKDTKQEDFSVPQGIVFINIDNETGGLVSPASEKVVRQAFVEGTEPQETTEEEETEDQDFLREDLSQ